LYLLYLKNKYIGYLLSASLKAFCNFWFPLIVLHHILYFIDFKKKIILAIEIFYFLIYTLWILSSSILFITKYLPIKLLSKLQVCIFKGVTDPYLLAPDIISNEKRCINLFYLILLLRSLLFPELYLFLLLNPFPLLLKPLFVNPLLLNSLL
jgi:hypothetical protein